MATLEDRLTLAAFNAATEGCGFRLVWGSYTGNGQYGGAHPNTLTFGSKPLAVMVYSSGGGWFKAVRGAGVPLDQSNTSNHLYIQWPDDGMSWYYPTSSSGNYGSYQYNDSGSTYFYLALLPA